MDLSELTKQSGIAFTSVDEAKSAYETATHGREDAPPFEAAVPFLRYMKDWKEGEPWEDLKARLAHLETETRRSTDVFLPIVVNEGYGGMQAAEGSEASDYDTEFAPLKAYLDLTAQQSNVVEDVFERMAELSQLWCRIPHGVEEHQREFRWSKIRVALSGAGWKAWGRMVAKLMEVHEECPFLASETYEEWLKNLEKAHKASGWPVTIGWLPWASFKRLVGPAWSAEHYAPYDWMQFCGLIHVIKHVRFNPFENQLVATYDGAAVAVRAPDLSSKLTDTGTKPLVLQALGCAAGKLRSKQVCPFAEVAGGALGQLQRRELLEREHVAALSGFVFAGPWSGLVRSSVPPGSFVQHGLRLVGVKVAEGGRVRVAAGDEEDVMGYAWNLWDPNSPDNRAARERIDSQVPETYSAAFPADLIRARFPNLDTGWAKNPDAYLAMLDALVLAHILRGEPEFKADLRREFPLVPVMPAVPELDAGSSNQGKTACATMIGRVFSLGIDEAVHAADTGSAPDNRTAFENIRKFGTTVLDEFVAPRSKNHPFADRSLQTLCTGAKVAVGRAMENAETCSLKASIVLSAKAIDMPYDMIIRMIPVFLLPLTDSMRDDAANFSAVQSGLASVEIRLAALALAEQPDVKRLLSSMPRGGTVRGLRFPTIRAFARAVYISRQPGTTEAESADAVDSVTVDLQRRIEGHTSAAASSGVLSELAAASAITIDPLDLVGDLDALEMNTVYEHGVSSEKISRVSNLSAKSFLSAFMIARGRHGHPLGELVSTYGTHASRVPLSNKQVEIAFQRGCSRLAGEHMEAVHDVPGMHNGRWQLRVTKDGRARVLLTPLPTAVP